MPPGVIGHGALCLRIFLTALSCRATSADLFFPLGARVGAWSSGALAWEDTGRLPPRLHFHRYAVQAHTSPPLLACTLSILPHLGFPAHQVLLDPHFTSHHLLAPHALLVWSHVYHSLRSHSHRSTYSLTAHAHRPPATHALPGFATSLTLYAGSPLHWDLHGLLDGPALHWDALHTTLSHAPPRYVPSWTAPAFTSRLFSVTLTSRSSSPSFTVPASFG